MLVPCFSFSPFRTRSDRGASLVEYALLMALIALACFAALRFFGTSMSSRYSISASSIG